MKYILTVTLIFFCLNISFAQDINSANKISFDNNKQAPSILLHLGMKLPESDNYRRTGFGFWTGLSLNIPLGLNWSLQPDFSYWKSNFHNYHVLENVNVIGWSLLVSHTFTIKNFSLRLAAGPGLGNTSSPFGQHVKQSIIINFEVSSFINLTDKVNLVPEIRYQIAGSPAHNGNLFEPFLIGLGLQYKFLKYK